MKFVKVMAHALNIRVGPGITWDVIGYLRKGQVVELVGSAPGWCRILAHVDGHSGWVAAKYVEPVERDQAEMDFPWMRIALSQRGVAEYKDPGENPAIIEYLKSTTLPRELAESDETPWCSAFVNWCMEKAGYAGTDSAAAKSWLKWGKSAWPPVRGCVAVFTRDGGGHVGFFWSKSGTDAGILVLGGNQGNRVQVSSYPAERLLDYRMPF